MHGMFALLTDATGVSSNQRVGIRLVNFRRIFAHRGKRPRAPLVLIAPCFLQGAASYLATVFLGCTAAPIRTSGGTRADAKRRLPATPEPRFACLNSAAAVQHTSCV